MGISTDSYSASCGTDGEWTGAITHMGYPLFFKENYLHKVYGSYPANYQIQATECRGVMKGAGKSLAILNEELIYKSRTGICRYDGSLPVEISQNFGNIKYSGVDIEEDKVIGAVAGTNGKKYFISMKSEVDSKWYLLAYDSEYGIWHKEDETRVGQVHKVIDKTMIQLTDISTGKMASKSYVNGVWQDWKILIPE